MIRYHTSVQRTTEWRKRSSSLRTVCWLVLSLFALHTAVNQLRQLRTNGHSSEHFASVESEQELLCHAAMDHDEQSESIACKKDGIPTSNEESKVEEDTTSYQTITIPSLSRGSEATQAVKSLISKDIAKSSAALNALHCNITSQVRVKQTPTQWSLVTLDRNGQEKTQGGDELYISFTACGDKADAAAHVIDKGDGTYLLDFVETPMTDTRCNDLEARNGTLNVFFEYSCGIGGISPPMKNSWLANGSTRMSFQVHNITSPPIRKFPKPNSVNLSKHVHVVGFGDSIMRSLFLGAQGGQDPRFTRANVSYASNPNSPLNTRTIDALEAKLGKFHDRDLLNQRDRALVLGSAVWDILDDRSKPPGQKPDRLFLDHLDACQQLVNFARNRYPETTIYWKLPHALLPHRLNSQGCYSNIHCSARVRYMSNSRMRTLHTLQERLMRAISVPTIDTYDAYFLGAEYSEHNDGRHFLPELNKFVLDMLFES